LATDRGVQLRNWLARALLGVLILVTALVTVGVTAPADGAFSISIHPVLLRVDPAAIEQSRARALGLDVDVKIGSFHVHLGWTAVPLFTLTGPTGGSAPRAASSSFDDAQGSRAFVEESQARCAHMPPDDGDSEN
jgi:hypothetical protein